MLRQNKWKILLTTLIILIPILVGCILWNRLPDTIATSFGVDSSGAFVLPGCYVCGSETEKYREKAAGDFLLDITVYFIADKYSNIWKCYGCEDGCRVSGMLVSGRSFCYDGKYTSQSGAELFVWH